MEIRPGLHRIEAPLGERFVALYLVTGTDGALLIDTGVRESITDTFLPYLEQAGVAPERVRWALNTHCDFDHAGGNGALKAAVPGVELLAHELDRPLIENVDRLIAERYGEFRQTDGFDDPPATTALIRKSSDPVGIDRSVADGAEIDLGGRTVRILHTPGHSPGHLAVHDPASAALIIGDATLGCTVPFADGRPAFPPTYRDVEPYLATVDRFRSISAELILTAHYPIYQGAAATAFLDASAGYVEQVDGAVLDVLADLNGWSTTLEIVRAAGDRLGPWPAPALDYAVFPVTGNLERLQQLGRVRSAVDADGRRRWIASGAR